MWSRIRRIGANGCARQARGCAMTPQQAENRGMLWMAGAFLFCPCHLPLTLASIAALLSGTGAAVLLQEHPYVAGSIVTAMWLAGTVRGVFYFLSAQR